MGSGGSRGSRVIIGSGLDPLASSDDEGPLPSHSHAQSSLPTDRDDDDAADEGQFAFRRNRHGTYLAVGIKKQIKITTNIWKMIFDWSLDFAACIRWFWKLALVRHKRRRLS